jgi:hypothetical protein
MERENELRRKRRRGDADGATSIHCGSHQGGASPEIAFPTTPLMTFGLPKADLIRAYGAWLQAEASEDEKGHYEFMQQLSLSNGYFLDCIESNKKMMYKFFVANCVPAGFAWQYVCCVTWFRKEREKSCGSDKVSVFPT